MSYCCRHGNLKCGTEYDNVCETMHKVEFFKDRGDDLIKKKKYRESVAEYTTALRYLDTKGSLELNDYQFVAKIWSNRSAAYHCTGDYQQALSDAKVAISIVPEWHKGYIRQAKSYTSLGSYKESMQSYIDAIEHIEGFEGIALLQDVALAYLDVAKKFAGLGSDTATLRRKLNVGFKKFGIDLFCEAMAKHARFDTMLPILRCRVNNKYMEELKDQLVWFDAIFCWAESQEENLIDALKQKLITTSYIQASLLRDSCSIPPHLSFHKANRSVLSFMVTAACISGSTKLLSYGMQVEFNKRELFETFDTCGDPLLHQIFKDSLNTKLFATKHVCAVLELLSRHSCVNLLVCNRDRKTVLQVHEFRLLKELRFLVERLATTQKKTGDVSTKKTKHTMNDRSKDKVDKKAKGSVGHTDKMNKKAKPKLDEKAKSKMSEKVAVARHVTGPEGETSQRYCQCSVVETKKPATGAARVSKPASNKAEKQTKPKRGTEEPVESLFRKNVMNYYNAIKGGISQKLLKNLSLSKLKDSVMKQTARMKYRELHKLSKFTRNNRRYVGTGVFAPLDYLCSVNDMLCEDLEQKITSLKVRRIIEKKRRIRILRRVYHNRLYKRHENCMCKLYVRDCKHTAHHSVPSAVMWNYWGDMLWELPDDHSDEFNVEYETIADEEILEDYIVDGVIADESEKELNRMNESMLALSPMLTCLQKAYQRHADDIDYKSVVGCTLDPALCLTRVTSDFAYVKDGAFMS